MDDAFVNVLVSIAIVWSLCWKGLALWKSARNRQLSWFVAIMVLNLLGLLEITYLLFFQKDKNFTV